MYPVQESSRTKKFKEFFLKKYFQKIYRKHFLYSVSRKVPKKTAGASYRRNNKSGVSFKDELKFIKAGVLNQIPKNSTQNHNYRPPKIKTQTNPVIQPYTQSQ